MSRITVPGVQHHVISPGKMRPHARLEPVARRGDQPRPHGIEGEKAHGGDQMLLINRHRIEASLKQMPRHPRAGVEERRVAPMRLRWFGFGK